jgi:nicotinamide riboside transporter PnuC
MSAFARTTWRHIPEGGILNSHRRENLRIICVFLFALRKNMPTRVEYRPHPPIPVMQRCIWKWNKMKRKYSQTDVSNKSDILESSVIYHKVPLSYKERTRICLCQNIISVCCYGYANKAPMCVLYGRSTTAYRHVHIQWYIATHIIFASGY